ncbi:DUF1549 and DUF1553 domain-containing protein [bacterium]|nr:DUF1549 and DUF1553 domain-containing protein [bacterium]
MRTTSFTIVLLLAAVASLHAAGAASPYEAAAWPISANAVDREVEKSLKGAGLALRAPTSDAVFIRRVYLDALGAMPAAAETKAFLADPDPGKRAALVAKLLEREEFVDYLSLKWGDLLRIKSEFPSNLWPNAVQAYNRWIRDAIASNKPYDRFVAELLTSSGSNFRDPPVNFFRAIPGRDPASIAGAVSLAFLGARYDAWPKEIRQSMAAFFSRVAYKKTLEWKEEIVYPDPRPLDATGGDVRLTLPDGTAAIVPDGTDPRKIFAAWLTGPGKTMLARAFVNRAWYWLMGTGIVEPADDIRPGNPPASPGTLNLLADEFIASGFNVKKLYALILTSRTYQQSSLPAPGEGATPAPAGFARYAIRRLDAEVIIDALCRIGGSGERYSSPIPEPFTYIPPAQRTIALADGSITSPFLVKFGRPARDTGLESERNNHPTAEQVLYLLNSTDVKKRIDASPLLSAAYNMPTAKRDDQIKAIYLELLSRPPTAAETAKAREYFATPGLASRQAAADLAWALVNGKEFLYRH